MKLLVSTLNMAARPFPNKEIILGEFVPIHASQPDIVVIGLQEADENASTQILREMILEQYELVAELGWKASRQLIFCRREIKSEARVISKATHPLDEGGIASRNKCGLLIAIKFKETTFCFLSAHLASHRKYVDVRVREAADLLEHVKHMETEHGLVSFDHVLFFGDVNFRLHFFDDQLDPNLSSIHENEGVERSLVKLADSSEEELSVIHELIRTKDYRSILNKCQLRKLLSDEEKSSPFAGFQESSQIDFPPTFKLIDHVENAYDSKRLPAYCDRILWKNATQNKNLNQMRFFSPPQVTFSDHRPVVAEFTF